MVPEALAEEEQIYKSLASMASSCAARQAPFIFGSLACQSTNPIQGRPQGTGWDDANALHIIYIVSIVADTIHVCVCTGAVICNLAGICN